MRYAIVSDIHGNIDALRAVLEHIEGQGIKHTMCLGNIVGAGPAPVDCIDLVRSSCFLSLLGNLDYAIVNNVTLCAERIARSLDWARKLIESGDPELAAQRWRFLEKLAERYDKNGLTFLHGSPRDPVDETIFPEDVMRNPRKIVESFAGFEKVLFVGHSHVPGVFTKDPQGIRFHRPQEFDGTFHYRRGEECIINVGSVGQSRDGDTRACYLEINKNHMTWHRVSYDVESVAAKIEAEEALAPIFARRLREAY